MENEETVSISEAYLSWGLFRHSSRELWLLLFLKLAESFAMTSEDLIFMLYLRDEMGFSETDSGILYSATAFLIFLYGVTVAGYLIDNYGVKPALLLG
jgi:dipeptide/tripeptide permease